MYISDQALQEHHKIKFPKFKAFSLDDHDIIQSFVDAFAPMSCEYNFVNLFTWQEVYQTSWTLYHGRLLIYDAKSSCTFMPLGEDFLPQELAILSLNLKNRGMVPNFSLATRQYVDKFPEIKAYYSCKSVRDNSEYIYDVDSLCELSGTKLHKKRNLISQFKRVSPEFKVLTMEGDLQKKALEFARKIKNSMKRVPKTLEQEMYALETSFENFDSLGLEGLAIMVDDRMIAFSVFSRLSACCYDIHFEKADKDYKGAAQAINHETALYLKNRCQYLNREQDLGIKGLRQAKMSYEPVELVTPVNLTFNPPN